MAEQQVKHEKHVKTRVINKHATAAVWDKVDEETNQPLNFTPLQGEMIVYDKDDEHPYERFKIGDGSKKVWELPFVSETYGGTFDLLWETGNQCTSCASLNLDIRHAAKYSKYAIFCTMRKADNGDPVALAGIVHRDKTYNKIFISTGCDLASRSLWIVPSEGSEPDSVMFKFKASSMINHTDARFFKDYYDYCLPYRIYGIRDDGVDYSDVRPLTAEEQEAPYALTLNGSGRVLSITRGEWAPLNSVPCSDLPQGYYIPHSAAAVDYDTPVHTYDISFYEYVNDTWSELPADDPVGDYTEVNLGEIYHNYATGWKHTLWTDNDWGNSQSFYPTSDWGTVTLKDAEGNWKYKYIDIEFVTDAPRSGAIIDTVRIPLTDKTYIIPSGTTTSSQQEYNKYKPVATVTYGPNSRNISMKAVDSTRFCFKYGPTTSDKTFGTVADLRTNGIYDSNFRIYPYRFYGVTFTD